MGSKRVGLARTQALIENLKRELNLTTSTTLKNAKLTVAAESATYGAGAVSTEIAPQTFIQNVGGEIITTILVDLTGLGAKGGHAADAIGLPAGGAAYLAQYTVAQMGILYKVELSMLELGAAASGTITNDFDIITNASATKEYDQGVGSNTLLVANSTLAKGTTLRNLVTGGGEPDEYIYLCEGDTTASTGVYSAGKLVIRLYGRASF